MNIKSYILIFYFILYSTCLSHKNIVYIHKTYDWLEGVQLKIPCAQIKAFIDNPGKPVLHDRRGDLYNLWTVVPDRYADNRCEKETVVAFNKQFPYSKLNTKEFQSDQLLYGIGGNVTTHKTCQIPFYVKDSKMGIRKRHYRCLESGRNDHNCWCSPTGNADEDKLFLFCPCAADKPGYFVDALAKNGEYPKRCTFPFTYKGKTYHGCTKDGTPDRRCWCYTGRGEGYTGSFDPKDNQWGFCPCATTTLYGYWRPWLPWQSCVCGQAQLRGRYCRFPIESLHEPRRGSIPVCFGDPVNLRFCECVMKSDNIFHDDMVAIREIVNATELGHVTGTLNLYKAKPEHSAVYTCTRSYINPVWKHKQGIPFGTSRVNVAPLNLTQVVKEGGKMKLPKIENKNYEMKIEWSEWQKCDRCDETGEQKRIGFCYMHKKSGANLKSCYPEKTPCAGFKRRAEFNGDNEAVAFVQVRGCTSRKCSDQKQAVINTYAADKGGYPPPPKIARRDVVTAEVGSNVTLDCRDALPTVPVSWDFYPQNETGHHTLLRFNTTVKGREFPDYEINPLDQLVIINIQYRHEGFYNCHVDLKLTTSYSLIPRNEIFSKYVNFYTVLNWSTIGLFILLIVAYLCWVARRGGKVCNRKNFDFVWSKVKEGRGKRKPAEEADQELQEVKSEGQELQEVKSEGQEIEEMKNKAKKNKKIKSKDMNIKENKKNQSK